MWCDVHKSKINNMNGYDNDYMENKSCVITGRQPIEWHHAIYSRSKRFPELNAPENMIPLIHSEHERIGAMGWEGRQWAWELKVKEFGLEHMIAWHESLPMKVKDRFY